MRHILSILAVSSVLLLAGCATKTRSDALTTTLTAYGSTLRWGDFQSAAQFIEPASRAAHPDNAPPPAPRHAVAPCGMHYKVTDALSQAHMNVSSAHIRAARGLLNWTIRDLAERAGVPVVANFRARDIAAMQGAGPETGALTKKAGSEALP